MINFDTYNMLYSEAKEHSDLRLFITERGWQEWMENVPEASVADILADIYSFSREGIKGMLNASGLNLATFCRKYTIPYKTALKWVNGEREAPEYTIMLIGYAVLSNMKYGE